MPSRPKKWPSYALESLENTLALLKDFDSDLRRAQQLMADGEHERAQIAMSDARASALKCVEHLVRARTGEYGLRPVAKQREGASAWKDAGTENTPMSTRTRATKS